MEKIRGKGENQWTWRKLVEMEKISGMEKFSGNGEIQWKCRKSVEMEKISGNGENQS